MPLLKQAASRRQQQQHSSSSGGDNMPLIKQVASIDSASDVYSTSTYGNGGSTVDSHTTYSSSGRPHASSGGKHATAAMTTRSVVSDDDDSDDVDDDDCSEEEEDMASLGRKSGTPPGTSSALGTAIVGTKELKDMILQLEKNIPSLSSLTLSCKHLTEETATEIAFHLPNNTSLKSLTLLCGKRPIHLLVFHELVTALKYNTSIEQLTIHGAVISRVTSSWLLPAFAHKANLHHITMSHCKFVRSGCATILIAIQHNRDTLQSLNFTSCDWDEHNLDTIASSLPLLGNNTLNNLSIIDIVNDVANDTWTHLFYNIEQMKHLSNLNLSYNTFNEGIVTVFTKSLGVQTGITHLNLSHCELDNNMVMKLSKALRPYDKLTKLDISYNRALTDKVGVHLLDLLTCNTSILDLSITGCVGLKKRTVSALTAKLRYNNSTLKSILPASTAQVLFDFADRIAEKREHCCAAMPCGG
jgi:Ran GTPase-activating protein (RanGAP) involved in mRNA processing and transport